MVILGSILKSFYLLTKSNYKINNQNSFKTVFFNKQCQFFNKFINYNYVLRQNNGYKTQNSMKNCYNFIKKMKN